MPEGQSVYLLLMNAPARTDLPVDDAHSSSPQRRGRVLVIDDDATLAAVMKRALVRDHDVETVASGHAALRLLECDDGFDVILCDVMMSGIDGCDLYERLHVVRPDVAERIVLVSGGSFSQRTRDFFDRVPNDRLEKPFAVNALRQLVRLRVDAVAE